MNPCPSLEELELFLSGSDPGEVGLHLRGCARCQESADRLVGDESLRPTPGSSAEALGDWTDRAAIAPILEALGVGRPTRTTLEPASPGRPPLDLGELASLGSYDLEGEIGRGGMGVVFRARDRTTCRLVALKVLFAGDDERTRRRFAREVRAVAQVEHDHIVRLYATGDPTDPILYFVMEHLAGPSLGAEIAERGRIAPREAAELVAQAASGLEAAHRAGLIHGDVKPANILIDRATGRAKVADFGLARLISEAPAPSREGLLPGTPAYFSPEQVRGEATPDPRSDLYSLGVTLYECLAGEPPFRGEPHRILRQVLQDEPRPPRTFDEAIPRDLETICLKAMAKDPARRYESAGRFEADLRRFLRGEPILARPVGPAERLARWCRNNRRVASLAALSAFSLVVITIGSVVASIRITDERSRAIAQAGRAEAQRRLALESLTALIQGIQDQLATRPGTLELRRSLLEIARSGLTRVSAGASPGDGADVDAKTVQALVKIGDIDLILGRAAEARAGFDRAAGLARRVSSADPQSVPLRRELAAAYDRLGDQVLRSYGKDDPEGNFARALAIRRALVAERPGDPVIRRDLRVSQGKMSDLLANAGELDGSRRHLEAALASLRAEAVNDANRPLILADLRFTCGRLGRLEAARGKAAEALAAYRDSLAGAEALCSLDPKNSAYRRQRALALEHFGATCLEFGEFEEAGRLLAAFLADRAEAIRNDPADLEALRSLALAYRHRGDLAARRRDLGAARESYRISLERFEDLARRDPGSVMAHKDRLFAHRKLADLEILACRPDEAAGWAARELAAQDEPGVPPHADKNEWIAEAKLRRDAYRLLGPSLDDPTRAQGQAPAVSALIVRYRAVLLARSGRAAEAAEAAKAATNLPGDPEAPMDAAIAYALASSTPSPVDTEAKARWRRSAVDALRLAIKMTPARSSFLRYDTDLAGLRGDPAFEALCRP